MVTIIHIPTVGYQLALQQVVLSKDTVEVSMRTDWSAKYMHSIIQRSHRQNSHLAAGSKRRCRCALLDSLNYQRSLSLHVCVHSHHCMCHMTGDLCRLVSMVNGLIGS